MNWIRENITKEVVAMFLSGFLIGGFAIGIVDVKRPTPLFSSAFEDMVFPEDCRQLATVANNQLRSINDNVPFSNPNQYLSWVDEYWNMVNDLMTCVTVEVCDPILLDLNDAYDDKRAVFEQMARLRPQIRSAERAAEQAYEQWSEAAQDASLAREEYENYEASLPNPITPEQQAELSRLLGLANQLEQISNSAEQYFRQLEENVEQLNQEMEDLELEYADLQSIWEGINNEYNNENCGPASQYRAPDPNPNGNSEYGDY